MRVILPQNLVTTTDKKSKHARPLCRPKAAAFNSFNTFSLVFWQLNLFNNKIQIVFLILNEWYILLIFLGDRLQIYRHTSYYFVVLIFIIANLIWLFQVWVLFLKDFYSLSFQDATWKCKMKDYTQLCMNHVTCVALTALNTTHDIPTHSVLPIQ